MRLQTIETGFFKLDGGAMFGVVPKVIWQNLNPPDDNNMCNWSMRCLLVEDGNRRILIDTGIGDKQTEKFFSYYYLSGKDTLKGSLAAAGLTPEDITDVVLTHLHFDHCGGAVEWNSSRDAYRPAFPNALYWSHEGHWNHALNSNQREKASFLRENFVPVQEAGQLCFVGEDLKISDHVSVILSNGHTEKMICPRIQYKDKTILYVADMIPSSAHIPVNFVMGYDIRPLDTMNEKELLLAEAAREGHILFFEHDPQTACATIQETEKGFRALHKGSLSDFIG